MSVRLARHEDDVHLSVIDNGCGLALAQREGIGLASMHGRATELGGSGTTVRAVLPAVPS